jgi:hypothetical protein
MAIAEPRETIGDFTIPGGIILPVYFFNILNGVESEIDSERNLKALGLVRIYRSLIGNRTRANK